MISITDQMGRGGPEYVYRVEVTPVEPRLTIGLPERSTYVDIVVPVPQREPHRRDGQRPAGRFRRRREPGDARTCRRRSPHRCCRLPPIRTTAQLLLSAPADAKPQAALVDVVGRHKEGGRTIEGRLVQKTMLVRGDNNREVWNYFSNRMAVAVTEPVPFHIEIVPPKVPLVQNGKMELKVAASRDNGFKGANRASHALQPARRLDARFRHDPRRPEPGGHSAHRRRRRDAADLEDRRARGIDDG